MPSVRHTHLDDFSLLCYAAGELGPAEHDIAAGHIRTCETCRRVLSEIEKLELELSAIGKDPVSRGDLEIEDLPLGDVFRGAPASHRSRPRGPKPTPSQVETSLEASE